MSLASGVDFGNPTAIGLRQDLSPIEKLVISTHRSFMEVLQLVSPTGSASASQRGLRGHVISIRHDAVDSVASVLPRLDVTALLEMIFIGNRKSWCRRFQKEARSLPEMRVRVDVIYSWLYALKHLNPLYSHVTIEDCPSTRNLLEGIQDQLLRNVVISDDPKAEELLRQSTSDVAQLASSSEDEERVATRRRASAGRINRYSFPPLSGTQKGGGLDSAECQQVPDDIVEGSDSDSASDSDLDDDLARDTTSHRQTGSESLMMDSVDSLNDAEGQLAREAVTTLMPILITESAADLNGQGVNPSVALLASIEKAFGHSNEWDCGKPTTAQPPITGSTSECSTTTSTTTLFPATSARVGIRFDESKLINKFTDNDIIIFGTCPHIFLLGKGL